MTRTPHLASASAACCWIPLFALRCEVARRSEPGSPPQPGALLSPEDPRRLWQVSPLARHAGVKPGMTVSQAIGLCAALKLYEPDPVHYDEQFARLLAALAHVSPVVEPAELGLAYVGTDGLEGLYGTAEKIVEVIQVRSVECGMRNFSEESFASRTSHLHSAFPIPHSALRLGWGKGKFVAWVAATRANPGGAVIVHPGEEGKFLFFQPLAVLPLDPDTHRRLRQLGLKTLGHLAALPEDAIVSQFGRTGRRLWRLAAGPTAQPGVRRPPPGPRTAPAAPGGWRPRALKPLGRRGARPGGARVARGGGAGRGLWRPAAGRAAEPVIGPPTPEPITATLPFSPPVAEGERGAPAPPAGPA